jgi:hypothetical protein
VVAARGGAAPLHPGRHGQRGDQPHPDRHAGRELRRSVLPGRVPDRLAGFRNPGHSPHPRPGARGPARRRDPDGRAGAGGMGGLRRSASLEGGPRSHVPGDRDRLPGRRHRDGRGRGVSGPRFRCGNPGHAPLRRQYGRTSVGRRSLGVGIGRFPRPAEGGRLLRAVRPLGRGGPAPVDRDLRHARPRARSTASRRAGWPP